MDTFFKIFIFLGTKYLKKLAKHNIFIDWNNIYNTTKHIIGNKYKIIKNCSRPLVYFLNLNYTLENNWDNSVIL